MARVSYLHSLQTQNFLYVKKTSTIAIKSVWVIILFSSVRRMSSYSTFFTGRFNAPFLLILGFIFHDPLSNNEIFWVIGKI